MENKAKVWLARNKDGRLWVYKRRPSKVDNMWICSDIELELHRDFFPSVSWEDNKATEAYITLTAPKEIDWEQRMAEIAESIFVTEQPYINCEEEVEKYAEIAIQRAKILINKLKKESDA